MRRIILIILFILLFAGCAGKQPSDISDAHYKYGQKLLQLVDGVLDFEITAKQACEELDTLKAQKGLLPKAEAGDLTYLKNSTVEIKLSSITLEMTLINHGKNGYDALRELRNSLAETLNEKLR